LSPTSLNDNMSFKACLDKFFEAGKTRLMKNTFQRYELQSVYFYKSSLAKVKMSELKGVKIIEWIDWMKTQRTAQHKKRKSFIQDLKVLKTVLNWYKNFLNEDFNVPITVKHKQLSILRPAKPRRPDYFIQPEDAKKWVSWLKENRSNPVYWRLACFMLLTGARVSEACGLKWSAVDLDRGFIRILR
ncbi:MAG: tyrosine-type recombinase/integrase, partial [Oligoflexia bacterium]|nr:tyrosine-type recombinase/integrase [Oligoflexia bacterium]